MCDESGEAAKASLILQKIANSAEFKNSNKEVILLIGPEGGFTQDEFVKMRQLENLL